jgi:hypothetical protein
MTNNEWAVFMLKDMTRRLEKFHEEATPEEAVRLADEIEKLARRLECLAYTIKENTASACSESG